MAYKLTLPVLNRYVKYFNALNKAGIDFEIQVNQEYDYGVSNYTASLTPLIKNVKNLEVLAKVWEAGTASMKVQHLTDFPGFRDLYQNPNAEPVTAEHYKQTNPSIKFFAQEVFAKQAYLDVHLLFNAPIEKQIGDHTYRVCCTKGDFYHAAVIYCAPETNDYYNYIDQGHILVSSAASDKPEAYLFVTDMMTLDMNYIVAAFAIHPESILPIIQNKAFVRAKDARVNLLKVERAIPAKLQPQYQKLKAEILADFEKNAQNVMIGKLTRDESPFVDINNVRISKTRAQYEHVSIEADNLSQIIFASLNPNEEWDIFTLINIYTDWVESQFKTLALNDEGTGFKTKKIFEFKINDIELKVECFTENTRRAINGVLVNIDELSKIMKRASCFEKADEYNNFVKEVGYMSLRVRDILANGMPVKTLFLANDESSQGQSATAKHPKLRFTKAKKGGFQIVINTLDKDGKITKSQERRIGKFVEFLNKVDQLNKRTYMTYYGGYQRTHEGGYELPNGQANPCAQGLIALLGTYAEGITDDEKTLLVGAINKERSEAEKRSEELLKEACQLTGATKANGKDGKPGYRVAGKLRNYFVEEGSLRVFDADTNQYFCVVNKGEQGVGQDALVARLFALHNDSMVAGKITTLAKR